MKVICQTLKKLIATTAFLYSFFVIAMLIADAAEPQKLIINSYKTGTAYIIYCVILFSASVLQIAENVKSGGGGILSTVLPNGAIVLSLLIATLSITNYFNRSMHFITSELSKSMALVWAAVGLFTALDLIGRIFVKGGDKK